MTRNIYFLYQFIKVHSIVKQTRFKKVLALVKNQIR